MLPSRRCGVLEPPSLTTVTGITAVRHFLCLVMTRRRLLLFKAVLFYVVISNARLPDGCRQDNYNLLAIHLSDPSKRISCSGLSCGRHCGHPSVNPSSQTCDGVRRRRVDCLAAISTIPADVLVGRVIHIDLFSSIPAFTLYRLRRLVDTGVILEYFGIQ